MRLRRRRGLPRGLPRLPALLARRRPPRPLRNVAGKRSKHVVARLDEALAFRADDPADERIIPAPWLKTPPPPLVDPHEELLQRPDRVPVVPHVLPLLDTVCEFKTLVGPKSQSSPISPRRPKLGQCRVK